MSKHVATPGTLRVVYGHDSDGDPRYDIYDDQGNKIAGRYTSKLGGEARIRRKGKRALRKHARLRAAAANGGQFEELVVSRAKYNAHLEQEIAGK